MESMMEKEKMDEKKVFEYIELCKTLKENL